MDTQGSFTPKIPYSWDSTSNKSPEVVQEQVKVMNILAEEKLLTAAKDISNPGCLGTLGMLLETSRKGAEADLSLIPKPQNVDFLQWLKAYQGCGFVVTCSQENAEEIIDTFKGVGLSSACVGEITCDNTLRIKHGKDIEILFDFSKDIITGCC
jgi:selenophosphate synthetase-related protein